MEKYEIDMSCMKPNTFFHNLLYFILYYLLHLLLFHHFDGDALKGSKCLTNI